MNFNRIAKQKMVSNNLVRGTQNGYANEYLRDKVHKKSFSAFHPPYEGTSLSPENIRRKLSGKVENHVEIV